MKEKPSIGKLVFEGNKKVDADDLKNEVGIKLYTIFDQNEIKQSINRLKEFYRKKGYYNVEMKERTEPLPNNQVSVTYVIDEGQKIFITKIEFIGNKAFDDQAAQGHHGNKRARLLVLAHGLRACLIQKSLNSTFSSSRRFITTTAISRRWSQTPRLP